MSRITRTSIALAGAALLVSLIVAGFAFAQANSEEAQGSQLLQQLQQGQKSCSQVTASDFELIGEAWMGRVLGSPQAHQAMNQLMSSMMGSSGEQQMHEFMGRRASSCGGGTAPPGFAAMMGRMGLMDAYQGGTGMMGGQSSNGGYGGMMGGSQNSQNGNDDNGISAGAMVGMMAVPIIAIALALLIFKPWRRPGNAQESLDRRFASGELSAEEYRERKKLLEGGGTR